MSYFGSQIFVKLLNQQPQLALLFSSACLQQTCERSHLENKTVSSVHGLEVCGPRYETPVHLVPSEGRGWLWRSMCGKNNLQGRKQRAMAWPNLTYIINTLPRTAFQGRPPVILGPPRHQNRMKRLL